ncbi:hypothetical protein ACIHEJ_15150 [Streptomyces sp. NPDC052301]
MALDHILAERGSRQDAEDGCPVFRIVGDEITEIDPCVPDTGGDDDFRS